MKYMSDDKPHYEKEKSRLGRDMSRDKLCDELNKLLVKGRAELEKRKILGKDNPKEKVAGQFAIKSLGIISISEGPIQWCNIKRRDGRNHRTYTLDYVIQDIDINSKIPDKSATQRHDDIKIKTHRVKSFSIFGKAVDLRWKTSIPNFELVNLLNDDEFVKKTILESKGKGITADLEIKSVNKDKCWIIRLSHTISKFAKHGVPIPTIDQWTVYNKIATYALAMKRIT